MSLSSHTLNEPLALSALLYSRQLVVLYQRLSGFLLFSALIFEAHQIPTCRFVQQSPSPAQTTDRMCRFWPRWWCGERSVANHRILF